MDRMTKIIRTNAINVAGNAMLAAAKGIVGIATGSIAITLDAVNSLADGMSSVIAMIGTKISGRPASQSHPFGYGRSEYLTTVLIAALILAAGLSSLREAVSSILDPTEPTYTAVSLVVVATAAAIKFGLGFFLMRRGRELASATLTGSGKDSLMDGVVSVTTFSAAIVYVLTGVSVEAYLAATIAVLIVKNGFDLLRDTCSKLLGERADPLLVEQVENAVRSVDGVRLASGLVLQDYGPNSVYGSVFITVDPTMCVADLDTVCRTVQKHVFDTCHVMLSGVTAFPDVSGEEASVVRAKVGRIVWGQEHVVELRGLYVDIEHQLVRLDAIVELGFTDFDSVRASILAECGAILPGWQFQLRVIPDITD